MIEQLGTRSGNCVVFEEAIVSGSHKVSPKTLNGKIERIPKLTTITPWLRAVDARRKIENLAPIIFLILFFRD
jgi:hypothetical protein